MTEHKESAIPDVSREGEKTIKIEVVKGDTCTAFRNEAIGTLVTNPQAFMDALTEAIRNFDWSTCRAEGQAFIPLPEAKEFVSSGSGKRTNNPNDFVVRAHRGRVDAYLKRENAAPIKSLNVVVYTCDALSHDPQVVEEGRHQGYDPETTHIIVAVLASSVDKAPYGSFRLVSNLAGNNNEALAWSAEEIRAKAEATLAYEKEWATVAD